MSTEKKDRNNNLSIYEAVRERLGLRKYEFAQQLGHVRQWYNYRCNPNCKMTTEDVVQLFEVAKMKPAEFMALMKHVTSDGKKS